jgi:hypothetical protein
MKIGHGFKTLIITVLAGIILLLLEYGTELKVFNGIWIAIKATGKGILWFLTISVPLWILLLLFVITIFAKISLLKSDEKPKKEPKENSKKEPNFLDYKEEVLNGIKYKWEWTFNPLIQKYEINRFFPFCLNCNYALLQRYHGFECPNCKKSFKVMENDEIYAHLQHNLATNKYVNKIQNS